MTTTSHKVKLKKAAATESRPGRGFTQRGWLPPRRGGYTFTMPDNFPADPKPPSGGAGVALADTTRAST